MAIRIDIPGDNPVTLRPTTNPTSVVINTTTSPAQVTNTTVESVAIKVLTGAKGDQNVYAGDTPPDNPQEGWIWINTSVG